MDDDEVLAEQRAYYQARAPEYDVWWQRRGRFDRGPESAAEWNRDVARVAAAFEAFGPGGDVLELPRAYAVVFFSFWLSHVPRSRFSDVWSLVRSCLAPEGRVFLVDNRNEAPDPYVIRRDSDVEIRRVHDGREFRVVEVFYEPEELRALLRGEGWTARLDATRWFIFGEARCAD